MMATGALGIGLAVAAASVCAACGRSGNAGPDGIESDGRDPAALPDGAGTATIDMAGGWELASLEVEVWDPWSVDPAVTDLVGQPLEIAADGHGGFRLERFAWVRELDVASTWNGAWRVDWSRNEGDGRLLIFAFRGVVTRPIFVPPGRRSVPDYALGVALGATGVDTMVGRCAEFGGGQGQRVFTFVARRVRR